MDLEVKRFQNGIQVVDARSLHAFLGVRTSFTEWFRRRRKLLKLTEGEGVFRVSLESRPKANGRPSEEYYITLEKSYELSVLERNDQGEEARKYFYQKLNSQALATTQPANTEEALLQNISSLQDAVNLILQQRKRIEKLEERDAMRDSIRKEMLALPPAKEVAPVVETRAYLNKWIRNYIATNDITYSAAWGKFYKEFEMAAHIRLPKENRLDIIEERGLMEKAYAFAQKIFPEHP
jgi:anti-repressor protein